MNLSLMVLWQIDHPDHGLNLSRVTGEPMHSNKLCRAANHQPITIVWLEINNRVLIQSAATVIPIDFEAIRAGPSDQQITALATGQLITPAISHQHIITFTPLQSIRTGIANQQPFSIQFPLD